MKPRLGWLGLILIFLGLLTVCLAEAVEVPPLLGRVNDLAGMMSEQAAAQLEERLAEVEARSGHQIAVLTIPSLQGDSLEDFSIRVAEAWKVGHKGADNGAILVIVRDDRKVRIEVGYGLEGVLPDAIAHRIIQEVIVPRFRDRDFNGGIESGASAIVEAMGGDHRVVLDSTPTRAANSSLRAIFTLLLGTFLFGLVVGFAQPTVTRGAATGALTSAVVGVPAIGIVGIGIWLLGIFTGTLASVLAIHFARHAWGRTWNPRPTLSGDYSPRDTFRMGYSGRLGSGNSSGGSRGSSRGSFSGGGGGFGGGGASGGW